MYKNKYNFTSSYLILIVFSYFIISMLGQYIVSPTADLDQAEQLLFSQTFQWGYSEQPPFYTWIVLILFSFFGPSLLVLISLKIFLLTVIFASALLLAKNLRFNVYQQQIVIFGLIFIPQIIWESQRDLTHSVLVTVMAALTFLQLIRTKNKPHIVNYFFLGLVIGFGLISKYNFIMFLGALFFSSILVSDYRKVFFNTSGVFLTVLVAIIVVLPHALWLNNNLNVALNSINKLGINDADSFMSIYNALIAAAAYLSPLWLFSIVLIGRNGFYENKIEYMDKRFLLSLLAFVFINVLLFVLVTEAQKIKDRWYQPLLFFVPLLIASFARPSFSSFKIYRGVAIFFALIVLVVLSLRTVLTDFFQHSSRPNIPYAHIIRAIPEPIPSTSLVLAESKVLAGNARAIFKTSQVDTPHFIFNPQLSNGSILILCEFKACLEDEFGDWLVQKYELDKSTLKLETISRQFYYSKSIKKTIYWTFY